MIKFRDGWKALKVEQMRAEGWLSHQIFLANFENRRKQSQSDAFYDECFHRTHSI
jgi:hypothetical protein